MAESDLRKAAEGVKPSEEFLDKVKKLFQHRLDESKKVVDPKKKDREDHDKEVDKILG